MNAGTMPSKADAVVIGGGVVGAAMLYGLVEQGLKDVVLVERDRLGCGTTWHSAANIALIDVSTYAFLDFYLYNMELFSRLAEETGQEVGWRKTGRVQMATNEARVRALKHTQAVAHARGVESTWIGPNEVRQRLPILRVDDLIGGLWTPTVGRVNATDFIAALSKSARSRGAVVMEQARVRNIGLKDGAVSSVETDRGTICTSRVINCAGLWAPQIARMVGVDLPIHANEHFYILTKAFPGIFKDMPSFRDSDACIYGREEVDGLLLGCFEDRAKPIAIEALPDDFSFGLLPDDWEQFEPYMMAAIHRIPALQDAEVKMLLNGPENFTPDGRFLAGPIHRVPGFYVLAGMNSAGVNNAAGSARALAEMIVGKPVRVDLSSFSPERFLPFHSRPGWLRDRVSEAPGYLYSIGRVPREFRTGRNVRRSPFHGRLAAAGAAFGQVMGWERPVTVKGLAEEMRVMRRGAGLADCTAAARWRLEGAGAAALVKRIFGGLKLQDGECEVGLVPSGGGGVGSAMLVARLGEEFIVVGDAAREPIDTLLLRPQSGEVARLVPCHSRFAALALQGATAEDVMLWLGKAGTPPRPGEAALLFVGGAEVAVLRHPWTGAFLLLMATEYAEHVADQLLNAPPDLGIGWVGAAVLEFDRIERGIPSVDHELVGSVPPPLSGLKETGTGRFRPAPGHGLLRGSVAGELGGGEPIWSDGAFVGLVSSASPSLDGRSMLLAHMPSPGRSVTLNLEGTELAVEMSCAGSDQ